MKINFDFKSNKKWIVLGLAGAALVGIICICVFAGTYRVRSYAMAPNLTHGKLVRASSDTATVGDMVLYKRGRDYQMARVIADSGDKVRLENGRIFVNGKRLNRDLVGEHIETIKLYNGKKTIKQNVKFKKYVETLSNGKKYDILEAFDEKGREEYTVPSDSFFVIGDNRDFSGVTRSMNGWNVPKADAKKIK